MFDETFGFGKRQTAGVLRETLACEHVESVGPSLNSIGRSRVAATYHVPVNIHGKLFNGLVDTGATITMAASSLLDAVPSLYDSLRAPSVGPVTGVSGTQLELIGEVWVPICVGNLVSAPHRILVVEDRSERFPFILGLDFLDKYRFSIDCVDRTLKYQLPNSDPAIIKLKVTQQLCQNYKVSCVQRVDIQPRTRKMIEVKVCNLPNDCEGCVEPILFRGSPLLLARSLNLVRNGITLVEVVNPAEESVRVEKDQKLASFFPTVPVSAVAASPSEGRDSRDSECSTWFDLSSTDLDNKQKRLVGEFLHDYSDVIGKDELDMGSTTTVSHKIDVQGADPIKQRYRRFHGNLRSEINDEIDKLLRKGIIEPSSSAWASPLVPVRKKNGNLRICVDFRAVNSKTRKDSFPLPNLSDAVSQFKGNQYFSSLDLLAGYHQVPLDEDSREITAFTTGEQLYQYTKLPFGVTNGPATFSRLVSIVLTGIPFDQAQAYLDDILVVGKDFKDHLRNLDSVFARLRMHGLKLGAPKCELFRSKVNYLGHVIGREGIKPLTSNIQAIVDFPVPRTVRQLRSFAGMVNFYKKFIKNSAELMKPLYDLTAAKSFCWSSTCESAFQTVKQALVSAPLLAYPTFNEDPFVLTVDASATGAGAVLSQVQDGEEKVIGYAGVSFNRAQIRYSTTDRELAAIRFAVNHFRVYLYGRRYIIRTDHKPLIYLNHMKRVDDRLLRTVEDLAVGHYELEYLPGKANVVADCLSRACYPWEIPEDYSEYKVAADDFLDDFEVVTISGGPNSLFEALSYAIYRETDEASALREFAVDTLLSSPTKYGFQKRAIDLKLIKSLYSEVIFPPFEVLQAFSDDLGWDVVIYFESGPLVRVKSAVANSTETAYLVCLGGMHFNCLIPIRGDMVERLAKKPESVECSNVSFPSECSVAPDGGQSEQKMSASVGTVGSFATRPRAVGFPKLDSVLVPLTISDGHGEVLRHQLVDHRCCRLVEYTASADKPGKRKDLAEAIRKFGPHLSKLSVNDAGLLLYDYEQHKRIVKVPVLPGDQLESLSRAMHECLGHAGRDKVLAVMKTKYFHPSMSATVARVVQRCGICQCHKGRQPNAFPLYRRQTTRPYEMYAVDLMDLPKSNSGFRCLLVGIDLHSKFGNVVPLRNKTARTVAAAFEAHVLSTTPRTPAVVLSDSGPEFRSKIFRDLLQRYGIQHDRSVPYAPHTNGCVERLNQTLRSRLATTCHRDTGNWDKKVYEIVAQYNRMPHAETGRPPVEFFLEEAAQPILPVKEPVWKKEGRSFRRFAVGDLVLRKVPFQASGQRDKLAPKFNGPYRVVTADGNGVTYRIRRLQGNKKEIQVHLSQIKKFHGDPGDLEVTLKESESPQRKLPIRSTEAGPGALGIHWDRLKFIPFRTERSDWSSKEESTRLPDQLSTDIGSWEYTDEDIEQPEEDLPQASTPVHENQEHHATLRFDDQEPSVLNFSGFTPDSLELPLLPGADEFSGFIVVPPTPPLLVLRRQRFNDGEVSELRGMYAPDSLGVPSTSELQLSEIRRSSTDPYSLPLTVVDLDDDAEDPEAVVELLEFDNSSESSTGDPLGTECCCA